MATGSQLPKVRAHGTVRVSLPLAHVRVTPALMSPT
jgi:hypothetical protein